MTIRLIPRWSRLLSDIDEDTIEISVADPVRVQDGQSIPFDLLLPSPGPGRIEIMSVSGGSGTAGDPWTVVREQRGTTATRHRRRAKVSGISFYLTLADGATVVDLTGRTGRLKFTGASNGGDESLTCTTFMPDPVVVPTLGSEVVLWNRNIDAIWTGLLEAPDPRYLPRGGAIFNVQALGYSIHLSDAAYISSKSWDPATEIPPGLTTAKIVKHALQDLCPVYLATDFSHITAGGQGILTPTGDALTKHVLELINEYQPLGDAFIPSSWHIRSFDGTGNPQFELKEKESAPKYWVNLEDTEDGVPVKVRRSDFYNQLALRWHDGIAIAEDSSNLVSLRGITRTLSSDASATIGDSYQADSLAKTLLAQIATVKPKAGEIKIRKPGAVHLVSDDSSVDLWDVLEGEVIQVLKNGSPLASGNSKIPFGDGCFFIRHREMDFEAGRLTLSTQDEVEDFRSSISKSTIAVMSRQDAGVWGPVTTGPKWSNPNSPNLPIPSPIPESLRLSKEVDGRVGYQDLAKGADTASFPLLFTGGGGTDDPTPIAVGEAAGGYLFTPGLVLSAELFAIAVSGDSDPSAITVQIRKVSAGGTTTDLFAIALDGTTVRKTMERVQPDDIAATDTIIGLVTANDPDVKPARYCMVTLRWKKKSGEAPNPPDTSNPAVKSVTPSRGGGANIGATFHIVTTKQARAQVRYGNSAGAILGYSGISPLGTDHMLTIPPIPSSPQSYEIVLTDMQGHTVIDSGHILF